MNEIQKKLIPTKYMCCGCSACYAICPASAIKMVMDVEGFYYPNVIEDKCVECKQCINICAFKEDYHKGKGQKL